MPEAATMTHKIKQDSPHCHAPIHPPAPAPTPTPHPGMELTITGNCAATVMIEGQQAAVVGSMSTPCSMPGCVPAGPGVIVKGSGTVMACKRPTARVDDTTLHAACVAPIPGPNGKVKSPGASSVIIGG